MKYENDLYGKSFMIVGVVEEHLKLNDNEWIKLRFPDGATITINIKHCKEVQDERKKSHD